MLKTIGSEQRQAFKDAVRAILPTLCFTPSEVEAFIHEYAPQPDGRSVIVEDVRGRPTFCRCTVDGAEVFIDYILPSIWKDRYALVKGAILQLRDAYLAPGSKRYLRMHVDERVPSHAAYFLGLLPQLGFGLQPRVTMTAPQDLVERLALPSLPRGFAEVAYESSQLESVVDVLARAYSGRHSESPVRKRTFVSECTP